MKITLTVAQRINLVNLVGGMRGSARIMRKAIKLLDVLEISSEEADRINLKRESNSRLTWDRDATFDLEFKDKEVLSTLKSIIEEHIYEKNKNEDWTFAEYAIYDDLCTKLDIDPDIGIKEGD